jgi:hypothetical protein
MGMTRVTERLRCVPEADVVSVARATAIEAADTIEELVEALTSAAERLGGISLLHRGRISDEELAFYDKWAAEIRETLAKARGEA